MLDSGAKCFSRVYKRAAQQQHKNKQKKKPILLHLWGPNTAELMAEIEGREQHRLISALASHR